MLNLMSGHQPGFYTFSGTQTIEFASIPVKHTGQKLSYGIYFKTGRSIWLDSVYVQKKVM